LDPHLEMGANAASQADRPDDVELVAAINAGSHAAFESLYLRHRDWVVAMAFRLTGDEGLAHDVLQEVFLYLLRKFPGFELRSSLRTFLYPAVRNLSLAARRKAGRCQAGDDENEILANFPAPASEHAGDEDLSLLLKDLPGSQREALLLRFVEGFSLEEIAAAVGVPLGTVKSRLHNALRALRDNPRTRELLGE